MRVERLEELGGSHGFTEGEDAVGMILGVQKVEPLMNVVAFEQAVGGERAAASAVGAGVGEEDGESVGEEELSISESYRCGCHRGRGGGGRRLRWVVGMDGPGAEGDVVGGGDGRVGEFGVESVGEGAGCGDSSSVSGTAGGVESAVGDEDAAGDAERQVEDQG